jgi:hypothetical protein
VLCAGTTPAAGPEAADPAPVPAVALGGGVEDAAGLDEDAALAEQALTPSSAVAVRTAAAHPVRSRRPSAPRRPARRVIDMYPIMPDLAWCPGPPSDAPSGTGNNQDALRLRCRSSSALRYSATINSVSSSTEVSSLRLSKVILPPCSRFTRSHTSSTWP